MLLNSLECHILRRIKRLSIISTKIALSRNLDIPCFALFLQVLDFIVNEKEAVKSENFPIRNFK